MISDDNSYYIGWFQDAKRNGYGKNLYPDGTISEGLFYNDEFIGEPTEYLIEALFEDDPKVAEKFNEQDYLLPSLSLTNPNAFAEAIKEIQ